jgi:hypothetical protein
MAWIGAIVIVIGAAYLVMLGVEAGWWGRLSPLAQCLSVAGFGALLIAAGEAAFRRIGPAASVGLFGAGLGTLYLDAFAAFEWFNPSLVSHEGAFVLMGIVALVGFGITLRSAFLTIGILSIIGGYLTPLLLRGASTHTLEVGMYLTTLLGISLGLSAARPRPFRTLRYVALAGHGLVGLGWVLGAMPTAWIVALVFCAGWWAAVQVEAVLAAVRRQSPLGNVAASLLATAWFVTVGAWVLATAQPPGFDWLGSFTVAVAVLAAAIAAQFGPRLSALGDRPQSPMDKLAVALWAQAGILLTVAVALQFDGYGQSIGWLLVGLGSVEIGRRLGYRGVEVFGLAVGGLAVGRVALVDWWLLPVMKTQLWSSGQVSVTNFSILALAAIVALHLAARRLRDVWRATPILLAATGTLGWLCLCAAQSRELTTTAGWLLAGVVLFAAERLGRRQRYFEIGLLVLVAAAAKWLMIDAVLRRLDPAWDPTATVPVFNWQMGLALAIAVVGWWASRLLVGRSRHERLWGGKTYLSIGWQAALIAGTTFLLVALSFELDHILSSLVDRGRTFAWSFNQVRQLYLTLLWTLGAFGLGLLARSLMTRSIAAVPGQRPHLLVRFAWTLLCMCAVKWLVGDTLYWAVVEKTGRTVGALPVANVQMLVGVVLATAVLFLYGTSGRWWPAAAGGRELAAPSVGTRLGAWVPVAATVLLLWGLTFEIDRVIGRFEASRPAGWTPLWEPLQLRALWWTALWALGGLAMMLWTRIRWTPSMLLAGWFVLVGAAVGWLGYDTIAWRLLKGVVLARVVFNVQFAVGALTAAGLGTAVWYFSRLGRLPAAAASPAHRAGGVCLVLVGLIGLWLGSLEIDRFFAPEAERLAQNAAMARQTGLSIYWGVYAIVLIALGFAKRSTACRYGGLALLTVTLAKVLTVDLAEVRYVYRVLSLIGVGLLFVATSVGYAKLAPRLGAPTQVTKSRSHEVTE